MSPPSLPGPVGALELAGWQVTHHRHADELLGRVDDAEHGVEVLRAARGAERWRGALGDNRGVSGGPQYGDPSPNCPGAQQEWEVGAAK